MSGARQAGWLAMLPRAGLFVRTRRCVSIRYEFGRNKTRVVPGRNIFVLEARSAKREIKETVVSPEKKVGRPGRSVFLWCDEGEWPGVWCVWLARLPGWALPATELVLGWGCWELGARGVANCQMCHTTFSGFSSGGE